MKIDPLIGKDEYDNTISQIALLILQKSQSQTSPVAVLNLRQEASDFISLMARDGFEHSLW